MSDLEEIKKQDEASGEVARWISEIQLYDKESQNWVEQAKKIIKRYKDDRGARSFKSRYNVLWSNVQTLLPAIYSTNPRPNVERRFQDDDDLGRVASDVLERSLSYFVKEDDFYDVVEKCVLDRLLPGRGTAWVRYNPVFQQVETDDFDEEGKAVLQDHLDYEEVCIDYVHWQDFGHTWARTWEEVRAVWKKAYMSRKELVNRFGEDVGNSIPLDYSPTKSDDSKVDTNVKKATVYEVWDKCDKKVYWVHKDVQNPLDIKDDPLGFKGFFPCPKPLFATLANDSVIPVPDYILYQDQARELDELTGRISSIVKALKVIGVYDSSAEGVQRMLVEGVENTLIKVDQYAMLAEKGGLKGVIELLPLQDILNTLLGLYQARDKVKQDLYEITGISDIVRGATDPNETLGAQELKGQYANLRLGRMQKDAERFSKDIIRIMSEIISEHFSIDTIKQISGVKLLTSVEKQLIGMYQQMISQGIQVQPPSEDIAKMVQSDPDKLQEMLSLPTWEEVDTLLKNDALRCFRIDVETDSTIKVDQDKEKAARIEFLTAVGSFMRESSAVQDPTLKPLMAQMLMFGVRGFRVGKDLESEFKIAIENMKKEAQQPPPPNPKIEEMKMKMDMEKSKNEMELQKISAQSQSEMAMAPIDIQTKQIDLAMKKMDLILKRMEMMGGFQNQVNGQKEQYGA